MVLRMELIVISPFSTPVKLSVSNSFLSASCNGARPRANPGLAGDAVRPRRTWWIKESRSRSVTCFAESASSVAIR